MNQSKTISKRMNLNLLNFLWNMEVLCFYLLRTTAGFFFFFFFSFAHLPTRSSSQTTDSFYYDTCAPSVCGNVSIKFPFSSTESICGLPGFTITCKSSSFPTIPISGRPYQVKQIYYNQGETILIAADLQLVQQLSSNSCDGGDGLRDHFLPAARLAPFYVPDGSAYINFSWCRSDNEGLPLNFTSAVVNYSACLGGKDRLYMLPPQGGMDNDTKLPTGCDHATVPVMQLNLLPNEEHPLSVIAEGFMLRSLEWDDNLDNCSKCEALGGRCGYNQTSGDGKLECFCKDAVCREDGRSETKSGSWKIVLAAVIPTSFLLAAGLISYIKIRKKGSSFLDKFGKRSMSSGGNSKIDVFISNYKSMLPTEYSYADVRKITDGFTEKLGEGGYGRVYKGKLPNGLPVAVKVLEKSKDDGQDFTNEVATIGQIRHVNIIRLLGFCCEGSRRALMLEFMPRGSLADLISNEEARRELGARRLLDIALGIARGVEYLHSGCEKRILHLDIKPQNVLLDNNLEPRLSDFGLAKLYSRKDSAVSLTGGARGTAGYIAPEVFMGGLGGVSHKSDVYSFGMLVLEMVMGKKTKDSMTAETESSSDKYFPNWIYHQLQGRAGADMDDTVVGEDDDTLRKMVMVGLWCIQTDPRSRPGISRALEMLRGDVECIAMPPKPLLFSLPRQQMEEDCVAFSDHIHGTQAASYYVHSNSSERRSQS